MAFEAVYYEPESLQYELGSMLRQKYEKLPWIPIDNHNCIDELRTKPNEEFAKLKRCLIIGTRKTHKYTENQKISDFLVPYTSSGCTAACLYCYLVCNYNKCSYLRLFVNREQMLDRLCNYSHKTEVPCTFEIGSNSDLVLENTVTGNLEWTIPAFAERGRGMLTFPTKFDAVEPLLGLAHGGRTIFRMSVNPDELVRKVELGTSPLDNRINAVNRMHAAGYPCGILIAPVMLVEGWRNLYSGLLDRLSEGLSPEAKEGLTVEVIFMTYSFVHRSINRDAFPNAMELYDASKMRGGGRGKYRYYGEERGAAEAMLRRQLEEKLPETRLVYVC